MDTNASTVKFSIKSNALEKLQKKSDKIFSIADNAETIIKKPDFNENVINEISSTEKISSNQDKQVFKVHSNEPKKTFKRNHQPTIENVTKKSRQNDDGDDISFGTETSNANVVTKASEFDESLIFNQGNPIKQSILDSSDLTRNSTSDKADVSENKLDDLNLDVLSNSKIVIEKSQQSEVKTNVYSVKISDKNIQNDKEGSCRKEGNNLKCNKTYAKDKQVIRDLNDRNLKDKKIINEGNEKSLSRDSVLSKNSERHIKSIKGHSNDPKIEKTKPYAAKDKPDEKNLLFKNDGSVERLHSRGDKSAIECQKKNERVTKLNDKDKKGKYIDNSKTDIKTTKDIHYKETKIEVCSNDSVINIQHKKEVTSKSEEVILKEYDNKIHDISIISTNIEQAVVPSHECEIKEFPKDTAIDNNVKIIPTEIDSVTHERISSKDDNDANKERISNDKKNRENKNVRCIKNDGKTHSKSEGHKNKDNSSKMCSNSSVKELNTNLCKKDEDSVIVINEVLKEDQQSALKCKENEVKLDSTKEKKTDCNTAKSLKKECKNESEKEIIKRNSNEKTVKEIRKTRKEEKMDREKVDEKSNTRTDKGIKKDVDLNKKIAKSSLPRGYSDKHSSKDKSRTSNKKQSQRYSDRHNRKYRSNKSKKRHHKSKDRRRHSSSSSTSSRTSSSSTSSSSSCDSSPVKSRLSCEGLHKHQSRLKLLQMGPLNLRDEFLLETECDVVNRVDQLEEPFATKKTSKAGSKSKLTIAEKVQLLLKSKMTIDNVKRPVKDLPETISNEHEKEHLIPMPKNLPNAKENPKSLHEKESKDNESIKIPLPKDPKNQISEAHEREVSKSRIKSSEVSQPPTEILSFVIPLPKASKKKQTEVSSESSKSDTLFCENLGFYIPLPKPPKAKSVVNPNKPLNQNELQELTFNHPILDKTQELTNEIVPSVIPLPKSSKKKSGNGESNKLHVSNQDISINDDSCQFIIPPPPKDLPESKKNSIVAEEFESGFSIIPLPKLPKLQNVISDAYMQPLPTIISFSNVDPIPHPPKTPQIHIEIPLPPPPPPPEVTKESSNNMSTIDLIENLSRVKMASKVIAKEATKQNKALEVTTAQQTSTTSTKESSSSSKHSSTKIPSNHKSQKSSREKVSFMIPITKVVNKQPIIVEAHESFQQQVQEKNLPLESFKSFLMNEKLQSMKATKNRLPNVDEEKQISNLIPKAITEIKEDNIDILGKNQTKEIQIENTQEKSEELSGVHNVLIAISQEMIVSKSGSSNTDETHRVDLAKKDVCEVIKEKSTSSTLKKELERATKQSNVSQKKVTVKEELKPKVQHSSHKKKSESGKDKRSKEKTSQVSTIKVMSKEKTDNTPHKNEIQSIQDAKSLTKKVHQSSHKKKSEDIKIKQNEDSLLKVSLKNDTVTDIKVVSLTDNNIVEQTEKTITENTVLEKIKPQKVTNTKDSHKHQKDAVNVPNNKSQKDYSSKHKKSETDAKPLVSSQSRQSTKKKEHTLITKPKKDVSDPNNDNNMQLTVVKQPITVCVPKEPVEKIANKATPIVHTFTQSVEPSVESEQYKLVSKVCSDDQLTDTTQNILQHNELARKLPPFIEDVSIPNVNPIKFAKSDQSNEKTPGNAITKCVENPNDTQVLSQRNMFIQKTVILEPLIKTCNISFRFKCNDQMKETVQTNEFKWPFLMESEEKKDEDPQITLTSVLDNCLTQLMEEKGKFQLGVKHNIKFSLKQPKRPEDVNKLLFGTKPLENKRKSIEMMRQSIKLARSLKSVNGSKDFKPVTVESEESVKGEVGLIDEPMKDKQKESIKQINQSRDLEKVTEISKGQQKSKDESKSDDTKNVIQSSNRSKDKKSSKGHHKSIIVSKPNPITIVQKLSVDDSKHLLPVKEIERKAKDEDSTLSIIVSDSSEKLENISEPKKSNENASSKVVAEIRSIPTETDKLPKSEHVKEIKKTSDDGGHISIQKKVGKESLLQSSEGKSRSQRSKNMSKSKKDVKHSTKEKSIHESERVKKIKKADDRSAEVSLLKIARKKSRSVSESSTVSSQSRSLSKRDDNNSKSMKGDKHTIEKKYVDNSEVVKEMTKSDDRNKDTRLSKKARKESKSVSESSKDSRRSKDRLKSDKHRKSSQINEAKKVGDRSKLVSVPKKVSRESRSVSESSTDSGRSKGRSRRDKKRSKSRKGDKHSISRSRSKRSYRSHSKRVRRRKLSKSKSVSRKTFRDSKSRDSSTSTSSDSSIESRHKNRSKRAHRHSSKNRRSRSYSSRRKNARKRKTSRSSSSSRSKSRENRKSKSRHGRVSDSSTEREHRDGSVLKKNKRQKLFQSIDNVTLKVFQPKETFNLRKLMMEKTKEKSIPTDKQKSRTRSKSLEKTPPRKTSLLGLYGGMAQSSRSRSKSLDQSPPRKTSLLRSYGGISRPTRSRSKSLEKTPPRNTSLLGQYRGVARSRNQEEIDSMMKQSRAVSTSGLHKETYGFAVSTDKPKILSHTPVKPTGLTLDMEGRTLTEKCIISFLNQIVQGNINQNQPVQDTPTVFSNEVPSYNQLSVPTFYPASQQTNVLPALNVPNFNAPNLQTPNLNYFVNSQPFPQNPEPVYPPICKPKVESNPYSLQTVLPPTYPNFCIPQSSDSLYPQQSSYGNYPQNYPIQNITVPSYEAPIQEPRSFLNSSISSLASLWKSAEDSKTDLKDPRLSKLESVTKSVENSPIISTAAIGLTSPKKSSSSSLSDCIMDMEVASPSVLSMCTSLRLDQDLSDNDDLSSCSEFKFENVEVEDPFEKYADAPKPQYEHIVKSEIHNSAMGKRFEYAYLKSTSCNCVPPNPDQIRVGKSACDEHCFNRQIKVECNRNCPVYELCTNRRFQEHTYAPMEPFYCGPEKGWGVRAQTNIEPGTFVIEYVGELIDFKEFLHRIHQNSTYNRNFLMVIQKGLYIDAGNKGNWSRFVNHSCSPNTIVERWVVNGKTRIGFFANRPIYKDEEITIDYQFQQYGSIEQKCYCKSSNCNGILGKINEKLQEQIKMSEIRQRNELIQRIIARHELKEIKHVSELITVIKEDSLDRDTFFNFLEVLLLTSSNLCIRTFIECGGLNVITGYLDSVAWNDWTLKLLYLQCLEHFKLKKRTLIKSGYTSMLVVEYWSENPRYELKHVDDESLNVESINEDADIVSDSLVTTQLDNECQLQFALVTSNEPVCELEKKVQSVSTTMKEYFNHEKTKFFIPKIKGNPLEFCNELSTTGSESKSMSIASSVQGDFVQTKKKGLRLKCSEVLQKLSKEEFRRLFSERFHKSQAEKNPISGMAQKNDNDRYTKVFGTIKQLLSGVIVEEVNTLKQSEQFYTMPMEFQNLDIDKILSGLHIVEKTGLLSLTTNDDDSTNKSASGLKFSDDISKCQRDSCLYSTDALPPNWKFCRCENGRVYFYHTISKKTQWDTPVYPWDAGEEDPSAWDFCDAHQFQVTPDDINEMYERLRKTSDEVKMQDREKKRNERTIQRKLSLSPGDKNKKMFSREVFKSVKTILKPFFSSTCKLGRIRSKSDMKYLCEKFSDTIIGKEVKQVTNLEDLELNSCVLAKMKSYIVKYMSRQGSIYKRSRKQKPK